MRIGKQLRSMVAVGALMGGAFMLADCSAKDAAKGCDGLDAASSKFDATVQQFSAAVTALSVPSTARFEASHMRPLPGEDGRSVTGPAV